MLQPVDQNDCLVGSNFWAKGWRTQLVEEIISLPTTVTRTPLAWPWAIRSPAWAELSESLR